MYIIYIARVPLEELYYRLWDSGVSVPPSQKLLLGYIYIQSRSYPRYVEICLDMQLIKNGGGATSFLFQKISKNVNFENLSAVGPRSCGNFQDNHIYPPRTPFFHVFLPKRGPANTRFTKTYYFMNRSVRRHLNEYKKYF